jgi:6-phosphofructokinase
MPEKKKKDKLLTTRFDGQMMAEFAVAADLLGARSINALVHQMVHQKISEARNLISRDEFEQMVENRKIATEVRSRKYQQLSAPDNSPANHESRLEMIGELKPKSKTKTPISEAVTENLKKKRTA